MGIQYRISPARVVVFAKAEKISFRAEVEKLRPINDCIPRKKLLGDDT